jgi:molybdopterin converting factor small subunit
MARLRLFGSARLAAGTAGAEAPGSSVAEVVDWAARRYGTDFTEVLSTCRVWVNGEPAGGAVAVEADDEVAILPPLSGG